jgi:hypothetical protein
MHGLRRFACAAGRGNAICRYHDYRPDNLLPRRFKAGGHARSGGVASAEALNRLAEGDEVPTSRAALTSRWSLLLRPAEASAGSDFIQLGELVRVSRGQVTGCNRVWIAGHAASDLPKQVLVPTITKARELIAAGDTLGPDAPLRCVVNLPADLDEIECRHRAAVDRFLTVAALPGANTGYIARHRRAWWAVQLYEPAPMVCTYMARRPPAFVRNMRGARHLNIAHGLYPREPLTEVQIRQLLAFIRKTVTVASGRTYAGGLTNFEPRELERILVPRLDALDAIATCVERTII